MMTILSKYNIFIFSLYDDPCEFLQSFAKGHSCPKAFTDNGLACTCPFNPVSLNVPPSTIYIGSVSAAWQFLATVSSYKIRLMENIVLFVIFR